MRQSLLSRINPSGYAAGEKPGSDNSTPPEEIPSPIVYGVKCTVIRLTVLFYIFITAFKTYRNPLTAIKALKKIINQRRTMQGNRKILKYVKADGKYYWSNNVPGFPSPVFRRFVAGELDRHNPYTTKSGHLNTIIFSITSRCPLHCEHCFEAQNIDGDEHLSLQDLIKILRKFEDRGIDQIQLSGGEPMIRFDDMIALIKSARDEIDFRMLTSGYGLTLKKATALKDAGLTGVNISLDHWDEDKHNAFRGNSKAYFWAMQAATNCRRVDMVVSLSLCATREFVTDDNLRQYIDLARDLGAGFIRILEPREVGCYTGRDVDLNDDQLGLLEKVFLTHNADPKYRDTPILMYPGYHQRHLGCFGAGDRYLFVDSWGNLHACPFCQSKVGNALVDDLDETIEKMKETGCHKFKMASGH